MTMVLLPIHILGGLVGLGAGAAAMWVLELFDFLIFKYIRYGCSK